MALAYLGALFVPSLAPRIARAEKAIPQADIQANERVPLALHIIAPTKDVLGVSFNTIDGQVDRILARDEATDLRPKLLTEEYTNVDQSCTTRSDKLTCYVERVWDYDPASPKIRYEEHGSYLLASELLAALKKDNPRPPSSFLAVITAVKQADGSARLTALLVDTESAIQAVHEAVKDGKYQTKRDELENTIAQYSVKRTAPPKKIASGDVKMVEAKMDEYLEELFTVEFRPAFEEKGHWGPYGRIELQGAQAGLEIEIDDRKIGATKSTRTLIGTVLPGDREIKLSLPGYIEDKKHVKVEKQQTSVLVMHLQKQPDEIATTLNRTVFWSGVALAAIGTAVTTFALVKASNPGYHVVCLSKDGSTNGCGSSEWLNFNAPTKDAPLSLTDNPNGSGLPIAPLGYSLAGAGVAWAVTTALFADDETYPFIEVGVGIAVFLASFILSTELNGKNCVGNSNCK
jgi:hypothetical protein